jgi:hypothetical protein
MRARIYILLAALFFLGACSDEPAKKVETKKEPAAPAAPVSGETAFFQMFAAARGWAPDVQILQVRSIQLPGVAREPGKAAAWEAHFVSSGRGRARSYTYSVIEAEGNLHKGVFAGLEEGWSGPRGATKPFIVQAVKVDTTDAYETAIKKGKGAAEFLKKYGDGPVNYVLEQTSRFPSVTWRVLWGESVSTSSYSVFIDASAGQYLETIR